MKVGFNSTFADDLLNSQSQTPQKSSILYRTTAAVSCRVLQKGFLVDKDVSFI